MGSIEAVTDDTFATDVLGSDVPVLVDFWAPWCGPCRIIEPHLAELAGEREDLEIVRLNVDENPQTAAKYGVVSIPTMNVYSGGEVVKQIIGARPKPMILKELSAYVQESA